MERDFIEKLNRMNVTERLMALGEYLECISTEVDEVKMALLKLIDDYKDEDFFNKFH